MSCLVREETEGEKASVSRCVRSGPGFRSPFAHKACLGLCRLSKYRVFTPAIMLLAVLLSSLLPFVSSTFRPTDGGDSPLPQCAIADTFSETALVGFEHELIFFPEMSNSTRGMRLWHAPHRRFHGGILFGGGVFYDDACRLRSPHEAVDARR